MKYRIKIITYESGRVGYIPQLHTGFWGWGGLDYNGAASDSNYEVGSRGEALGMIDLHYHGNKKVKSIEFEYINKP